MERRWKVADTFLGKLHARMEPIIGNHDFYEPLLPDGSPSPTDPRWRWRRQFGLDRTYRSFAFRGYRFLMLDSVKVTGGINPYRGWIDAAQLSWLDRELVRIPRDQPIILCTHVPFRTSLKDFLNPFIGPSPGRVRVLNADAVLSRLRDRPLVLVLQGHVHVNERLREGDVPFITGGAVCGKWWNGPNMGTCRAWTDRDQAVGLIGRFRGGPDRMELSESSRNAFRQALLSAGVMNECYPDLDHDEQDDG